MPILVDTNVILDVAEGGSAWFEWSRTRLKEHAATGIAINPIIFAELCFAADSAAEVDRLLTIMGITLLETPREGLFLAAHAHLAYRRRGGTKTSVLPDFFIGAHALASGYQLLTRDSTRYRTYFPEIILICPSEAEVKQGGAPA